MHKGEREKTGKAQIGKTEARKKKKKIHICVKVQKKKKKKRKKFYICVICSVCKCVN